ALGHLADLPAARAGPGDLLEARQLAAEVHARELVDEERHDGQADAAAGRHAAAPRPHAPALEAAALPEGHVITVGPRPAARPTAARRARPRPAVSRRGRGRRGRPRPGA